EGEAEETQHQPAPKRFTGMLVTTPGHNGNEPALQQRDANRDFMKTMVFEAEGRILEEMQVGNCENGRETEDDQDQCRISLGQAADEVRGFMVVEGEQWLACGFLMPTIII